MGRRVDDTSEADEEEEIEKEEADKEEGDVTDCSAPSYSS